ncbi:NirD/YgiW/YdeI family stress tolerance protein [Acinetobacter wanghuae]|uniref:NirD/YgiW/YdeI family stress tolerance protein n=1 Tax=Acinetobacter wanghuae TaxID=2662362 RepID=A0A5Q0P6D5_9GAMM|nr:NirD/YgiW/YdeI family stress tolerance protein [Acinetobacter wanghuae]MQW92602.1 NirD/YgiW/YdeI family stress tolerance protein [Acinetobacter wanghuae]QGA12162.1 NirD/YgiW/YdeI family stress tolerance protein [Acinetobacter wanghuae]
MSKTLWASVALSAAMLTPTAWAKTDSAVLKEAKANVVTIAQAKKLKDETGVTLVGQIVRQATADSDDFELKDKTGSIIIDVDDDLWKPLALKAGDKVRVLGEVDTHRAKPTDIDVIHIERVK